MVCSIWSARKSLVSSAWPRDQNRRVRTAEPCVATSSTSYDAECGANAPGTPSIKISIGMSLSCVANKSPGVDRCRSFGVEPGFKTMTRCNGGTAANTRPCSMSGRMYRRTAGEAECGCERRRRRRRSSGSPCRSGPRRCRCATGTRADHLDDRRALGVREHVADQRFLHVEMLLPRTGRSSRGPRTATPCSTSTGPPRIRRDVPPPLG